MSLKFNQMIRCGLFLLMLAIVSTITAQDVKWTKDLTPELGEVGWIEQSNDGILIAAGAKGLLGVDNHSGEIQWHLNELQAVQKSTFQNIEGLPIFYVEYNPLAGKTRGILVNSSTGDILYDTKDEGYKIKTYNIVPDANAILFEMTKDKKQLLMSFSLKTWEQSWVADLGEVKGLLNKITRRSFLDHGPIVTSAGDIVVGINANAYGIQQNSGTIKWNFEADKRINALVFSELNNSLYLGTRKSKKLVVLNPDNGKDITPGKLKLKGSLLDITSDKNNNIVLVETEGFNLINPETNELLWKKSFKIDYLDEVIPFENGYIAIGKDAKNGSIAYVDPNGKKIWDTKVKGYTYYATPTDNGVLYISTERSNIISFADGKDIWKKDVKFKSIPAVTFDEKENKVVLFENGKAYKFDLASGNMNIFAEDVKLTAVNRKTPLLAEYIPEGYLLKTDQHISLLSQSGDVVYSKHLKEIVSTDLTSLAQLGLDIAGVDLDIAGSMDNIKALDRLSKGVYRTNEAADGTSTTSIVAGVYVGNSPILEITKTRYFNSRTTKDHQYFQTSSGGNRIVKINKSTGAEEMHITLKDKTPQYIVDVVDNRVFVAEKNKSISCYQL